MHCISFDAQTISAAIIFLVSHVISVLCSLPVKIIFKTITEHSPEVRDRFFQRVQRKIKEEEDQPEIDLDKGIVMEIRQTVHVGETPT